ncbi:hypothetical protein C6569_11645 [Phreatobacter cathodiphilus]|uniref:Uncharacterized protein n=2 Tax=Phreatobacter cathodiphilus TaxID=1868589 RepID=A0A2S0NCA4_9HYPH|nr:hypothetical protein C6569_11645 [Phreatobacter cathodiphilus]
MVLAATATGAEAGPVFERLSGRAAAGDPCFARAYDADHLRRNPRQKVVRIHLARERVDVADENNPQRFTVRIGFRLRVDRDSYETNAVCTGDGPAADCTGEGDTGAFRLALAGEALRIEVERLEVEGARGSSPDLAVSDDRVFLLRPAAASACAAR